MGQPAKYKNTVGNFYDLIDENNCVVGNVDGEETAKLLIAAPMMLETIKGLMKNYNVMYNSNDGGVDHFANAVHLIDKLEPEPTEETYYPTPEHITRKLLDTDKEQAIGRMTCITPAPVNITIIGSEEDWLELKTKSDFAKLPVGEDYRCKFDNGTECNYYDKHPCALMTHWKPLQSVKQRPKKGIFEKLAEATRPKTDDVIETPKIYEAAHHGCVYLIHNGLFSHAPMDTDGGVEHEDAEITEVQEAPESFRVGHERALEELLSDGDIDEMDEFIDKINYV